VLEVARKTLRIALIGAGTIGRTHATRSADVKGAKLQVVVDIDETRARAVQETAGAPERAADYKEVLARDDIDAVIICLPTWLHEEVAVAAAEHGKHILCEKPMALDVASARRMHEAARRAGVVLMIAQCRRFSQDWLKVRELIRSGAIGRPAVIRTVRALRLAEGWFVQEGKGNGPLLDGAVHDYDFARYTFGEATQVMASGMTFRADATAVDTGTAIIRFEHGDELVVSWSWGLPPGARGGYLHDVIGPKGAIFFERSTRPDFARLPAPDAGCGAVVIDRGQAGGIEQVPYPLRDMYLDQLQAFVDAVHAGGPSPVDGTEGMKAVAIGQAVLESARTGRVVTLERGLPSVC